MSHICVIGRNGLIGSAIARHFYDQVTSFPTQGTSILFHFASHVHPIFDQNPEYEMKQVIDSFTQLLPYCAANNIMFVYPSSALVYEKNTQFSKFKKTLEQLTSCYNVKTLGLRIFPVYGPGEERTVISQWCRDMQDGKQPVVFGDGHQSRDFIYIDDVVDQIISQVEVRTWSSRVVDIGTGVGTSFNEIIGIINMTLGSTITPRYVDCPTDYSSGIVCANPLPSKVHIETGIRKILLG